MQVIDIGTEFNISEAWKQIHRNDERVREIELIKKSLECASVNLTMVEPFLTEPNPSDVKENS